MKGVGVSRGESHPRKVAPIEEGSVEVVDYDPARSRHFEREAERARRASLSGGR